MSERAFTFECAGERLVGILHEGAPGARRAVLVVVGGPQYRIGSHRQFVLLARALAARGVPVMRFDCRGMGDSDGEHPGFEQAGPDIGAAVGALLAQAPGASEVVVWGLCDAASAALLHVHSDPRVSGLALANPWVHTDAGAAEAQAYLRQWYARRIVSADFWRKVVRGGVAPVASLRALWQYARRAARGDDASARAPFQQRMLEGLERFRGPVLLMLSGNDLTAAEFRALADGSPRWRAALARAGVTRRELASATHTFSSRAWRDTVSGWTAEWLASW
jgi:uncharacterized protein